MRFRNRDEAAAQLASRLAPYRGQRPLVLGIPRGGMPMAETIAIAVEGDLDAVLVHKLRAPSQPELAVGSIDEFGRVYLTAFAQELGLDERALDAEKRVQLEMLRARRDRYARVQAPIPIASRIVILVDDGLATGATAIAAIRCVRAQRAARIVVAVGVAPPATLAQLRREADEVVCLQAPDSFFAVGEFFDDFSEVTDDEVLAILTRAAVRRAPTEDALRV
jgi:predicted phosphoribosyltransferase